MEDQKIRSLDPYVVFKVDRNFSLDEVKQKYKRLARKLHPDKNAGDPECARLFMGISSCYQRLLEDYCARISDKQFHELKSEFQQEQQQQQQKQQPRRQQHDGIDASTSNAKKLGKFDLQKFNTIFSENRIGDAYDNGYSEWMKKNDPTKCNLKKPSNNQQIVQHRPKAIFMTDANAYELGVTRVQDFSKPFSMHIGAAPGRNERRTVEYTDYRIAHTTGQLV